MTKTERDPSKINSKENLAYQQKHELLAETRRLSQNILREMKKSVKLETQHSQIKNQVAELVQKCEKQKIMKVENVNMIMYTQELRRNIMCQYRNRFMISRQLDNMMRPISEADSERKKHLSHEIQKKDEILREKVKDKERRLGKVNGITQKVYKLMQKIAKQEYLMTNIIEKRIFLSDALTLLNKRRDLMDHKSHNRVDAVLLKMQHNSDKYQQDNDDRKLAIEQCEKDNLKLLIERNQLIETLKIIKTEVEKLTEEKNRDFQELENYVNIRDDLKESTTSNTEDIAHRAVEITSLYTDMAELRKTLENCEEQLEIYKKKCHLVVHEHEQHKESIGNIEELTIQCKSEIIDFQCKIKKSSVEVEVLENILHIRDLHYEELENQRLLLKLDVENVLGNVEKLREVLILDLNKYRNVKQEREEMFRSKLQLEANAYNTKKLSDLQEQIMKEKENHTKLLRHVESLEQNMMCQNNELLIFILEKEVLTNKYTDIELRFKDIECVSDKKASQIMLLKEEIKQKTNENNLLSENCNKFEDYIQKHDDNNNETNDTNTKIMLIKEESLELKKKLSFLENTLSEEQMSGNKYRLELEELTGTNTSVENNLIELIHAKEETIELQKENEELEHKCKVMKSQYTELHNCTEALLSAVRTLKEKSKHRSRITDDPRTFSVTYDSNSSIF